MGLPQLDSPRANCASEESTISAHPDATPVANVSATLAPDHDRTYVELPHSWSSSLLGAGERGDMWLKSRRLNTSDVVNSYIAECRARRLSVRTVEAYQWALRRLTEGSEYLPAEAESLADILSSGQHLSSESHADIWRVFKTFFAWVAERHEISDPMASIQRPQVHRKIPVTLDEHDIERLLSSISDERDYAMVLLILDTGMRLNDVANLRWPHIKGNHLLLVDSKGGKQRTVYIGPETRNAMADLGDGYHIWLSQQPGRRFGRPMTRTGVRQAIVRVIRDAGFKPPKAGPHMLRHTFGRLWIKNGGSLAHLQRILGHAHIKSTLVYVTINDEDLEEPHRDYSPVANSMVRRRKLL